MDFFMKQENVDIYKKMLEGYSHTFMPDKLKEHLKPESTLLEIGMGTGFDLEILSKTYKVTGSDSSPIFVDEFSKKNGKIPVFVIDATDINCNETFDCIYSNKVLQHLTQAELIKSLKSQKEHLHDDGILFMSFWLGGDKEEFFHQGTLRINYYKLATLQNIINSEMQIICHEIYTEDGDNDSVLIVAKKK